MLDNMSIHHENNFAPYTDPYMTLTVALENGSSLITR